MNWHFYKRHYKIKSILGDIYIYMYINKQYNNNNKMCE